MKFHRFPNAYHRYALVPGTQGRDASTNRNLNHNANPFPQRDPGAAGLCALLQFANTVNDEHNGTQRKVLDAAERGD